MKNKSNHKELWTKDFTCITTATVLSIIGGEAMNLPISLLVFDQTNSTFLAALVLVFGMLPDIILPVLVAPIIDAQDKKKWIVGLDFLMMIVFVIMGFFTLSNDFNYIVYLGFVLIISTISVFYRLAYDAWYPDLIPVGQEQRGFAISGTIYPVVVIVLSPIATFLYTAISMSTLFFLVTGLSLLSLLLESLIHEVKRNRSEKYTVRQYFCDMREGFSYLKQEKGIRNIYTYMSITSGASHGIGLLTQAHYQTSPLLTVSLFGFLKSAEMIGRFASGIVQYIVQIPVKKRYAFTKFVYVFYDLMDVSLLFLPYPLMIVNRFLCGTLGSSSATIRETAVKSYLPEQMRARISAFFQVIFALGGVLSQLIAGILGQVMPYPFAALVLASIPLVSVTYFIILPSQHNRPIYEATRTHVMSEDLVQV